MLEGCRLLPRFWHLVRTQQPWAQARMLLSVPHGHSTWGLCRLAQMGDLQALPCSPATQRYVRKVCVRGVGYEMSSKCYMRSVAVRETEAYVIVPVLTCKLDSVRSEGSWLVLHMEVG